MARSWKKILVLLPTVAVVVACGAGTTSGTTSSSPGLPSTPSSTSSTPTPTPTSASPTEKAWGYAPVKVLTASLLTAAQLPGLKVTGRDTESPADGYTGGYDSEFAFVKGDAGCKALLAAHTASVATGSSVFFESDSLDVDELVESFYDESAAISVMDENMLQAQQCRSATVSYKGTRYQLTHKLIAAVRQGGQTVGVLHQETIRLARDRSLVILQMERRDGTEIMFLYMYPYSSSGTARTSAVTAAAVKKFLATVDAYRAGRPV